MDGFPSWEERVVHVWTNRARADPAADLASCTVCAERACYAPAPPVVWNHSLSRAARFHSANSVLGSCGLQHNSPCTVLSTIGALYTPGSCDGNPSCACQAGTFMCGSTGTGFGTRVGYFGVSASAENIARGRTDPVQTFYQWFHENDPSSACGWRVANGHRANILGGSRGLGVGLSGTTWTQDFGSAGTPSGIVGGVHYPRTGASIEFRANWYSAAAPRSAQVSVNGICSPLSVERGTAVNGTYLGTVAGISGCSRYVFHFVDGAGTDVYFPTTGAFTVGCGVADWESTRPATCGACTPSCGARTCGDDGCGGTCAPDCTGRTCGSDGCTGGCGSCGAGEVCGPGGACACDGEHSACAGACVDLGSSIEHCGGCDQPCAPGRSCVAGVCNAVAIDAGPRDAGLVGIDGAVADGGLGTLDGGTTPGALVGSCACRAGRASLPRGVSAMLGLVALLVTRRRRISP